MVTGQLAHTPTCGLPTHRLDISRTGQLADWTTRGLADAAKRTKTKLGESPVASASCPVRDLSSPRDVQSASWRIRELSSNQMYTVILNTSGDPGDAGDAGETCLMLWRRPNHLRSLLLRERRLLLIAEAASPETCLSD